MADMFHQITINAPADKVYAALTTEDGLKGWWTGDTEAKPEVGSTAVFGFGARVTVFRMQVAELKPNERVYWKCQGEPDEWKDTELTFQLSPAEDGGTTVKFHHGNWKSTEGYFPLCNSTWGHLMYYLKDYCEGKNPGPFFSGEAF